MLIAKLSILFCSGPSEAAAARVMEEHALLLEDVPVEGRASHQHPHVSSISSPCE